jgi:hypothetical protein
MGETDVFGVPYFVIDTYHCMMLFGSDTHLNITPPFPTHTPAFIACMPRTL